MKDIQAIGAILAIWHILPSSHATASRPASRPARKNECRAESSYAGGNSPSGGVNLHHSRSGISSLLAVALLQGGSSTHRRRN
jgi:hypothetical protein